MDKFVKSYSSFREQQIPRKSGRWFNLGKKSKKGSLKPISSRLITPDSGLRPRPLYARPKTEKNWRKIVLLSILSVSILTWLGLMLYLPFFQINRISIDGLDTIDYNELNDYVMTKYLKRGFFPINNYFWVRTGKIASDIAGKYAVDKVDVIKIFPCILSISIKEKITSIIYDNGYSYILLDSEGMAVKIISVYGERSATGTLIASTTASSQPATSTSSTTTTHLKHKPDYRQLLRNYADLPIFFDETQPDIRERQAGIMAPEIIKFIIDWQTMMRTEGIGEAKYFESINITAGIGVYIDKSWKILIQPNNSIAEQMSNLKILLSGRDVKPTEYIDLRYGERVFWK